MLSRAIFLATCLILTSCSTTQPREIPLPLCDQPTPITSEIWGIPHIDEMTEDEAKDHLTLMREAMSVNAGIYQECLRKYRERIEAFNESG